MFKKLIFVTGLVGIGMLIWSERARSKAKDLGDKVAAWVDKKMEPRKGGPGEPERKLLALRNRLKDLDVEVSAAKDRLAQQIVDHSRASADVNKLRDDVDTGTKVLTARAKEIDEARTELVGYAGLPMAVSAARKRLDRDLELVAAKKALLAETEEAARQRENGVSVLKQHVAELETLKLEAMTKLDRFDLELKTLRLHEVKDRYEANDTKAGQFMESLKELEKDIEVKKVRRSLDPEAPPLTAAEPVKPAESASDAVARKLGIKPADRKIEKAGD